MFISGIRQDSTIPGIATVDFNSDSFMVMTHRLLERTFEVPFSKLISLISTLSHAEAVAKGHQIFEAEEFQKCYKQLVSEISGIYGIASIAYQRRPTFRFQCPGNKSVSFHTDDLSSGHPKNIINVWIPLTEVNKWNTLYFVGKTDSKKILDEFCMHNRSISWIDEVCRATAEPWTCGYGHALVFSNKTLHGTRCNNSDRTRLSIDFRIADASIPNGFTNTSKNIPIDYLLLEPTCVSGESHRINDGIESASLSAPREATSVVFSANDAKHLDHRLQRNIINSFAARGQFAITREVGEWHCAHYPILNEICESNVNKTILIATLRSFDQSCDHFQRLLRRLKKHPGGAYFCLENVSACDL